MKYCTECGAKLPDDSHFCSSCGSNQDKQQKQPAAVAAPSTTVAAPASAQPAAPGKKKLSGCAIAAIVLGALAALLVLFVGGLVLLVGFSTSDVVKTTEDYLALLKQGKYREAYEASAEGLRRETSFDDFQQVMEAFPILASHTKYSVGSRNFENDTGEVQGELTDSNGNTAAIEFRLVKDKDTWRVLSLHIKRGKSADSPPESSAAPPASSPVETAFRNFQANTEGKIKIDVRKRQPAKISVRLTRDGQSSDYVFVVKEESGNKATVVVGPEDSEADVVYYLRKSGNGWTVDRIDTDPMK